MAIFVLVSVVSAVALEPEPKGQFGTKYAYVFVTGSRIPQKVAVKSIGTATFSPMRVIKYGEIQQSGRFTTEGVLAQDPSARVILGRAGTGF